MKFSKILFLLVGLVLVLASCRLLKDTSVQEFESVSVEIQAGLEQPELLDTSQTATAAQPQEINECLDCHSNQERLIVTAEPVVEPAESESRGVG